MVEINIFENSYWDYKRSNPDTDKKILLATLYPVVLILLVYLWFTLRSGPEFMKRRKPFKLGLILTTYNIMQVLLSLYIVVLGCISLYQIGFISKTCYFEKEGSVNDLIKHIKYVYFLGKISELLDTVFFVLRKKQNQVSFLHVYHHGTMVSVAWFVVKYHETDNPVFFATINSLVHVVMYSYYGLSVFPALNKFLWWKKYITALQMIQLTLIVIHLIISHLVSDCKPAYIYIIVASSNSLILFYLFAKFYFNSYENNKNVAKEKKTHLNEKNDLIINDRKSA